MIAGLGLWYSASDPAYDAFTYEQALPTLFDSSGNGWDAAQATGSNQAIWLTHDGRNYLRSVTPNGNTVATTFPSAGLDNVRLEMRTRPTTWRPASVRGWCGLGTGNDGQRRYNGRLNTTGTLSFIVHPDGLVANSQAISTAAIPNDGAERGIAIDWNGTEVRFYIGVGATLETMVWSQLGNTVAFAPSFSVSGGSTRRMNSSLSGADIWAGQIYEARYFYDGSPVLHFGADAGNFNSATVPDKIAAGNWTINKSGLNPAMIVSARAFLPLTDDFYDISASSYGLLQNVTGGTAICVRACSSLAAPNVAICYSRNGNVAQQRFLMSTTSTPNYFIAGRRLDLDASQDVAGGTPVAYTMAVQAGRIDYANALAANFANGALVGSEAAFQTAGLSSNTASQRARVFANLSDIVAAFQSGPVTDLCLYNRALTNAQIRSLSRYFAGRTGGAITV
jgi:hypothetical protein